MQRLEEAARNLLQCGRPELARLALRLYAKAGRLVLIESEKQLVERFDELRELVKQGAVVAVAHPSLFAELAGARALALLPQPILLVFMVYAAAGSLALPRDATAPAVIAAAATAVYATEVTLLFALRDRPPSAQRR